MPTHYSPLPPMEISTPKPKDPIGTVPHEISARYASALPPDLANAFNARKTITTPDLFNAFNQSHNNPLRPAPLDRYSPTQPLDNPVSSDETPQKKSFQLLWLTWLDSLKDLNGLDIHLFCDVITHEDCKINYIKRILQDHSKHPYFTTMLEHLLKSKKLDETLLAELPVTHKHPQLKFIREYYQFLSELNEKNNAYHAFFNEIINASFDLYQNMITEEIASVKKQKTFCGFFQSKDDAKYLKFLSRYEAYAEHQQSKKYQQLEVK